MFKWHYFDQVYSRFTRDGKMAFFASQTRPLRRETSQRRQLEVFLGVISLPLAVTDVCRRRILSRLLYSRKQPHSQVFSRQSKMQISRALRRMLYCQVLGTRVNPDGLSDRRILVDGQIRLWIRLDVEIYESGKKSCEFKNIQIRVCTGPKCLKNGSDRLPKGQLIRRRILGEQPNSLRDEARMKSP